MLNLKELEMNLGSICNSTTNFLNLVLIEIFCLSLMWIRLHISYAHYFLLLSLQDLDLLSYMESIPGRSASFHKLTKENFEVMYLRLGATNGMMLKEKMVLKYLSLLFMQFLFASTLISYLQKNHGSSVLNLELRIEFFAPSVGWPLSLECSRRC